MLNLFVRVLITLAFERVCSRLLLSVIQTCHTNLADVASHLFISRHPKDVGDSCSQHVTVFHTCLKCVGLCLYGGATYPPNEVAGPRAVSKKHHPSSLAPVSFPRCHLRNDNDHLFGLKPVRSVRDHQSHQSSWGLPVQQTRLENKSFVVCANSILDRFTGILNVRYGSTARG